MSSLAGGRASSAALLVWESTCGPSCERSIKREARQLIKSLRRLLSHHLSVDAKLGEIQKREARRLIKSSSFNYLPVDAKRGRDPKKGKARRLKVGQVSDTCTSTCRGAAHLARHFALLRVLGLTLTLNADSDSQNQKKM